MRTTGSGKAYQLGPDLIRITALVLVLLTHGIAITESYEYSGLSLRWCVTMLFMYLSHACVPLFLLLTGYLCGKRKLSWSYYGGLFRVLLSYLLISVIILGVARLRDPGLKLTTILYNILSFNGRYTWYVEMYIGLFLLIPFLNLLYDHLDRTGLRVLMATLVFGTLLPNTFASFGTERVSAQIIPDYFNLCYPITYYYIGRWIKEREECLSLRSGLALFLAGLLISTGTCYIFSYLTGTYRGNMLNTFACVTSAATGMGIFILLLHVKSCKNHVLQRIIRGVAGIGFEAYLFSNLTDTYLYAYLPVPFPFNTLCSLIGAIVLAGLISFLVRPLDRLCRKAWMAWKPASS